MTPRIKAGKRYLTRDGRVAFVEVQELDLNLLWPFSGRILGDTDFLASWTANGLWGDATTYGEDLIAEYHEPTQPALPKTNTAMPRVWGVFSVQDGLLELFWDAKKADEKTEFLKKGHPLKDFWVGEVIVS